MFSLLEFVDTCREPSTRKDYRATLCKFMEFVNGLPHGTYRTPEEIAKLDALSREYLSGNPNYFDDLIKFAIYSRNLSPKSQKKNMSVLKNWLEHNRKTIHKDEWRIIKSKMPKKSKALTPDIELSRELIKQFFEHMSLQGRAICLVLMSSGMRIGEALSFKLEDINFDANPVEIFLHEEYTKTKEERYCFISSEAAALVQDWLKVRDQWLVSAHNRAAAFRTHKYIDDPRVFPLCQTTVTLMFHNVLKKAGLYKVDARTNRSLITPHSFRKFFISQMKTAMTPDIVELLAGHAGYLTSSYRRYPKDQVRKEYLAAEYAVSLNAPENMPAIRADLEQSRETQAALASEMVRLRADMAAIARGDPDVITAYRNVKG